MKKFLYKAKDWNGKTVKGLLEAINKVEVLNSIKANGLIPLTVEEQKRGMVDEFVSRFTSRIGLKQIATFTRQLSTMMTAGLPLTDALNLLRNQMEDSPLMYQIVDEALNTVRGGQPLGAAIDKYKKYFGEAFVASIKAGEEGGVLEEILNKLADNLEGEEEFRGKVKGAMIYPVIVIVGMILVAFIMMIFVVPKLTSLYKDFGGEMPAITRGLMAISNFTIKIWFLFPLIPFAIFSVLKTGEQNANFRYKKDKFMLKLPIMGELNSKTIVANTTRSLSMLLSAGISLVESLKIVADVSGNEVYRRAYLDIATRVEKGFAIADCFEDTGVFPIIVNQMIATGEATGKLDEVLLRVSDYFATESEQSVKSLTSAIEPLIMIVLGVGVGFLVVAVIMPIYNLTSEF